MHPFFIPESVLFVLVLNYPKNRHPGEGRDLGHAKRGLAPQGISARNARSFYYILSATQVLTSFALDPALRRDDGCATVIKGPRTVPPTEFLQNSAGPGLRGDDEYQVWRKDPALRRDDGVRR